MNTEPRGLTTGVVVGRFQTPFLTEGHKHLIDFAFDKDDVVFIIIGITKDESVDERNPYTFDQRAKMILKSYSKAHISYIVDCPGENKRWSRNLDFLALQLERPTLYGSRDSFHKHYNGTIPFIEVPEIEGVSATKVREIAKIQLADLVFSTSKLAPKRNLYRVLTSLTEEVGELATEINIKDGFKNRAPGEDGIIGESIDVILNALDIIYNENSDITSAEVNYIMSKKLDKWKSKWI